jgi:hypothetical protein
MADVVCAKRLQTGALLISQLCIKYSNEIISNAH